MKYIHYGHTKFDMDKFNKIENSKLISSKPDGGFWASRVNAVNGWKKYCLDNEYDIDLDIYYVFSLSKDAKILTINNCEQLKQLPTINSKAAIGIWKEEPKYDFEKISKDYDALEVFVSEDYKLRYKLFGWDCDSIVIMNPAIICIDELK